MRGFGKPLGSKQHGQTNPVKTAGAQTAQPSIVLARSARVNTLAGNKTAECVERAFCHHRSRILRPRHRRPLRLHHSGRGDSKPQSSALHRFVATWRPVRQSWHENCETFAVNRTPSFTTWAAYREGRLLLHPRYRSSRSFRCFVIQPGDANYIRLENRSVRSSVPASPVAGHGRGFDWLTMIPRIVPSVRLRSEPNKSKGLAGESLGRATHGEPDTPTCVSPGTARIHRGRQI